VISRVDQRFRLEVLRFDLRCTCEACAAFDPDRVACAYGYPTGPHLRLPELDTKSEEAAFTFCKAFELA